MGTHNETQVQQKDLHLGGPDTSTRMGLVRDCTEVPVGRTVHYCQGVVLHVHGQEQRRKSMEEQWEGMAGLVYRYGILQG